MQQSYGEIGLHGLAASLLAVGLFILLFEWMWKIGDRLARRSVPVVIQPPPEGSWQGG